MSVILIVLNFVTIVLSGGLPVGWLMTREAGGLTALPIAAGYKTGN